MLHVSCLEQSLKGTVTTSGEPAGFPRPSHLVPSDRLESAPIKAARE